MSLTGEPTLRYFDARGRAQFLRAFLTVRDVHFTDERVPLDPDWASWLAIKSVRSLSGPFAQLPVLQLADDLIPEALVIAHYLHRETGDAAALGAADAVRHDALLSFAYTNLMVSLGILVWADLMFPGVDMPTYVTAAHGRFERALAPLDEALDEWSWTQRMHARPVTIADCLLWEELDQAFAVFGPHLCLDDKPHVARFHAEHPARATFGRLLAARPSQITGRPGEAATIEAIRAMLSSDVPQGAG
jgi:hypothetical protein